MGSSMFTFKKFTVCQEQCAMKVGTDGVLLGAWANGGKEILDIGTGTGLIALMMAQRFTGAHIDAVEIDHDAAEQAKQNVEASPFADRIQVMQTPIQRYPTIRKYASIVSNPPFFVDALLAPDARRTTARHSTALTYSDLFTAVKSLLSSDGEFSAIIPAECLTAFTSQAYLAGLSMTRRCAVRTTPRKVPKRYLLAFMHANASHDMEITEECIQYADGSRTDWYTRLTADFYIK